MRGMCRLLVWPSWTRFREHSGVVRWTEMSVCLPRDAGWHATIESSGTVPTVPSGSAT